MNTQTIEEVSRLIAAYNFRKDGRLGTLHEKYVDEAMPLARFLVMSGMDWTE